MRLADGERAALDPLLDELWPVILAYARRGLGHAADAEDVAQEVFLRICARSADFDRTRDGLAWAFGIAHYEVLSQRRRRQRRREVPGDAPTVACRPDPRASQEEAVIARQLDLAFAELVGGLSDADRRTLGLVPDLDAKTGATVRKRRARAIGRLRTMWRKIHGEP